MSFLNLAEVEVDTTGTLIPDGEYTVALFSWEQHQNAKGLGLKVQYMVTDGPMENRRIFSYYCVQHPNPEAVRIAGQNLKSLVIACGFDGNQDLTEALLNQCEGKQFRAKVGTQKDKTGNYEDSNTIKSYKPLSGAAPAPAPTAPPVTAAAPPVAPPVGTPPPAAPQPPSAPPAAPAPPPWQA